jgi:hypothetical protein
MNIGSTFNVRRVGFFIFGLIVPLISVWTGVHWPDFGKRLFGSFNFETQPGWFYIAGRVVDWLPWIVAAGLIISRISGTSGVKPISYLAGALTSYVAVFSFFLAVPIVDDYSQRRPFDASLWKASLADDPWKNPIRLRMVDDLMRKHPLVGAARSQVLDLLGQPPSTDKFSDWDLVYCLGPERGLFSIDSEWLVIRFDKNEKVIEAKDVQD